MFSVSSARLLAPLRGPLGLSLVLLAYGNLNSLLPWDVRSRFLIWANLILLVILLFEAIRLSRLSPASLGLSGGSLWRGAVLGAACAVLLAAVPVAFVVVAPFVTGDPVEYGDIQDLSGAALAYRLAFWSPIGTALFEEVAFRGVLYAKLTTAGDEVKAVWLSSLVFALWHVVITSRTVVESDIVDSVWLLPLVIVLCLVGTFVGGLVFAFLRWRTGHVAGPFMVHWLTVALMSLAVWLRA